MQNKQIEKLNALKDAFWNQFQQTGSIYAYGRYKGTQQVIKERLEKQKNGQTEPEM